MAEVPVAIAHGRLVVLGGDNKRLHEELIFAGGELREGRFTRIQQLGRLEQLLAAGSDEAVSTSMQDRLRGLWPEHRPNLLRALETRSDDRTKTLQNRLDERAGKEIAAMHSVIEDLGKRIAARLNEIDPQLELFSIPEKSVSRIGHVSRARASGEIVMSIARHHNEWLSLLEVSGPFLSLPVLILARHALVNVHCII